MPLATTVRLLCVAFLFGGTFICARIVALEGGPFAGAFVRFVVAGLFLGGVLVWRRRKVVVPAEAWPRLFVLGVTGVFSYNVCFFVGLGQIEAGRASLIIALNPVMIALGAALFMGERLGRLRVCGIAIGVTGALIVISRGELASLGLHVGAGELWILGCVASWTTFTLVGRAVTAKVGPLVATTVACWIGMAMLLPLALWEGLGGVLAWSPRAWAALVALGALGTGLAFVWYQRGVSEIGPARAGVFICFVPVFGVGLSALVFGEAITRSVLVGGVLAALGVLLTQWGALSAAPRSRPCKDAGRPAG